MLTDYEKETLCAAFQSLMIVTSEELNKAPKDRMTKDANDLCLKLTGMSVMQLSAWVIQRVKTRG